MSKNDRSALKEFIASIATIKGDLSNITAPPFLLASQSTVEFPSYWAEHPHHFVAPAKEPDPLKRVVLVLKWFLASLRRQQYAGRDPSEGVKKPLNAFLGELFFAEWKQAEHGVTKLISEQVSHHPPITACRLWNEEFGISAEGFACQQITFSGSVNIKQTGHAIIHLNKYDEDYLIPLPDVKVSGLLTGTAYPELVGNYEILSSNGYFASIDFSGTKMLGLKGGKNHVSAAVFDRKDSAKTSPLYTVEGSWSGTFSIHNVVEGTTFDTHDSSSSEVSPMIVAALEDQDPWESRRAWNETIKALNEGKMQDAVNEKSKIEKGQRCMRLEEETEKRNWRPVFFNRHNSDHRYSNLEKSSDSLYEFGFWKFLSKSDNKRSPFHTGLTPTNNPPRSSCDQRDQLLISKEQSSIRNELNSSEISTTATSDAEKISIGGHHSTKNSLYEISNPYTVRPLDPRVDNPLG